MSRIDALLGAMTLDEKIGQLTMVTAGFTVTGPVLPSDAAATIRASRAGSVLNLFGARQTRQLQKIALEETRLGIPLLLAFDVIHGHRTIFPIPLGETAAFDPALWEATARAAAREAADDGLGMTFAPMLDVARDPRWGRMAEGPGEDPLVASRFAAAKMRGFQGTDLAAADAVAATAKHFVAYGAATAGRDYASADISERTLREVYLPPFEAAIREGAVAIMPAFNDLAGVPMHANGALLRGWLRERMGFDGVLVSDYNGIAELINHGVAGDIVEAAALALRAGVDIDMWAEAYRRGLPTALERGLVTQEEIDAAVRRVLTLKERLGLFEDPYRRGRSAPDRAQQAAHRALARTAAQRAIVLLSNPRGVLPLSGGLKRIAVIGPLAEARADMLGSWAGAGDPASAVTIVEGLRAALPDCDVVTAAGVGIEGSETDGIAAAVALARLADLVVLCVGEAAVMSGEAASRADPGLPGAQRALAEAVLDRGWPVVALLSSGRPLTVPWLVERADAVVATWFLGHEAGHAIADVLTGRVDATGRTPVTWPRAVGQVPIFAAERPSGRPANPDDHYTSKYLDLPASPLFPFGHGLSYAAFRYGAVGARPERPRNGDTVEVSVAVTNTGRVAGEETVFLFIRDVVASVARPVLELKGFARVALAPGETKTVRLPLPVAALAFPGDDGAPRLEPGRFEILVGPSADRARLLATSITLEG